jgi:hypothetical protein
MKGPKEILEIFDKCCDSIGTSNTKDVSVLVKGIELMLKQMKLTREKAIELRKTFKGTNEEFIKKATNELVPILNPIQKEFDKINSFMFNSLLFTLPDKKGKIFFEIMAESEELGKLPFDDPARRKRIDKNIEKMESFLEFLTLHQERVEAERLKMIKPIPYKVNIIQMKISLSGSKPLIWRRLLVKDNITFHELHFILQKAMGWECSHLYFFEKGDLRIESEGYAEGEYSDFEPAEKLLISRVLNEGDKLDYLYDFGDSWEHDITIEKIVDVANWKKYPVCLEGLGACPPEDCGGIDGFYEMLKAVKNKKHPEHKHLKEWLGDYDPELFVLDWVNARLQGKKPKAVWIAKK